jgi:hypothetical protein
MGAFHLFRFTHPDGRAKDWAWRIIQDETSVGFVEVRWGTQGRLSGMQRLSLKTTSIDDLKRRETAKCRKGYVLISLAAELDERGRLLREMPRAATPTKTHKPGPSALSPPVMDLSGIHSDIPSDWF